VGFPLCLNNALAVRNCTGTDSTKMRDARTQLRARVVSK
jgi:hypothetical protein